MALVTTAATGLRISAITRNSPATTLMEAMLNMPWSAKILRILFPRPFLTKMRPRCFARVSFGYRSYRLSGAHADSRLGLYGFGASAHLVLQLARHEGCEAYVFTRSQAHRDLAKKLGAVWVGAAEDVPPQPLDASIVFAPAGSLIPRALSVFGQGGILVLAGVTMSPIPQMDYSLLYQERQIRTVANSTRQDVREFLELAAEAPVRTEVQVFDLEQANSALQALKKSEIKAAAVLQISRS